MAEARASGMPAARMRWQNCSSSRLSDRPASPAPVTQAPISEMLVDVVIAESARCSQAARRRAKPASRSLIRSPGSSSPTWIRNGTPSLAQGVAVRQVSGWIGISRLS